MGFLHGSIGVKFFLEKGVNSRVEVERVSRGLADSKAAVLVEAAVAGDKKVNLGPTQPEGGRALGVEEIAGALP